MNLTTPAAPVVTPVIGNKNEEKIEKPTMYAVVLLNDDSTGPDFVTRVLREAFSINAGQAYAIMMAAHRGGRALVHVVTKDLAETEIDRAQVMAAQANPGMDYIPSISPTCELTFVMEKEQ